MKALCYLILTGMKNRLLELWHKPAKLILYLLCFGGMAALILMPTLTNPQSTAKVELFWLKGIYFAFLALFLVLGVQKGLSNGDLIFEMQDVNFLFVSPISPQTILMYGLVQMTKMAFWAGFFILFQGSTLGNLFGMGFRALMVLFFSFILFIVVQSILSLVIYNFTNGRPERKRLVRLLTVAVFLPLVAVLGVNFAQSGDLMAALESTIGSPVLNWTPFAGWGADAALGLMTGSLSTGLLFTGVLVAAGGLMVAYLLFGKIDYYEDVLVATETAFEKKKAMSEGQINPEATSTHKVKVVKTGVGGKGASVFLYKHLRETMRANTLGLLSWPTVWMIAGSGALAYFMRGEGGGCLVILQILMWMQVFMIGMGRGMKELTMHYIYLAPESSFQKILWSNLEPVVRVLLESCLLFALAGVIGGESAGVVVGCILVFTLFSTMLIGANYLSMRWFGTEMSEGILLTLYFVGVLLLLAPGLAAAIAIGVAMEGTAGLLLGLGVLALWELLVSLGCFALSKGVLHHCDMLSAKK